MAIITPNNLTTEMTDPDDADLLSIWNADSANSQKMEKMELGDFRTLMGRNNNLYINGSFDIWQRGTSFSTSGNAFLADRYWMTQDDHSVVVSQQTFTQGQTDVPGNPTNFFRIATTQGTTTTASYCRFGQRIEGVNVASYGDRKITVSFYAKASVTAKKLGFQPVLNYGSGGSASNLINGVNVSLTTSWAKYTQTFTLPDTSAKTVGAGNYLTVRFYTSAGSDYNNNTDSMGLQDSTIDIAQLKVEKGAFATPFVPRHISEEIALCQRYYCKSYHITTSPGTVTHNGTRIEWETRNKAANMPGLQFPVSMRKSPTVTLYSATSGSSGKCYNGADRDASAEYITSEGFRSIDITSGDTASAAHYHWTADAEL